MPEESPPQPADKLLKATCSVPENARAFFKNHLPPELAAATRFSTCLSNMKVPRTRACPCVCSPTSCASGNVLLKPAELPAILPFVLAQGKRPWRTSAARPDGLIWLPPEVAHILRTWLPTGWWHRRFGCVPFSDLA
jgi:hypothetical protein